jgi:hypothetical protein
VPDSPYNELGYCQAFPRGSNDSSTQYWAQVGPADTPVGNFDNIGGSLLTVFTIFTTENWVSSAAGAGGADGAQCQLGAVPA